PHATAPSTASPLSLHDALPICDDGHAQPLLHEVTVDAEHLPGFGLRLLVRRMRRMALLPEELRGAQEETGAHLPADDVRPLIDQDRKHTSELQSRENLVCRLLL